MAVALGEGADQAATRRSRLSEPPPETPKMTVRRLQKWQPALRSAVVLILLVSGVSPSASNASSAGDARSAPTALGGPCTRRRCLNLHGGGGLRERGRASDAKRQGPAQVQPPILTART